MVYVGHAAGKWWWRNFTQPITRPIAAEHAYRRRFATVTLSTQDPMVLIDPAPARPPRQVASTAPVCSLARAWWPAIH